jgi:hypothetical protein
VGHVVRCPLTDSRWQGAVGACLAKVGSRNQQHCLPDIHWTLKQLALVISGLPFEIFTFLPIDSFLIAETKDLAW